MGFSKAQLREKEGPPIPGGSGDTNVGGTPERLLSHTVCPRALGLVSPAHVYSPCVKRARRTPRLGGESAGTPQIALHAVLSPILCGTYS